MLFQDINTLNVQQLCDLLVTSTGQLLDLLNHRGVHNQQELSEKKSEVEQIQKAIRARKREGKPT